MNTEPEKKPYAIVVGIDFSELSDLALERACDLARAQAPTHLHVISAEKTAPSSHGSDAFAFHSEELTAELKQASTRLREHVEQIVRRWCEARSEPPSFERLTTHIRFEPAAQAIAQLAADVEAKLIIVGTHGRRGVRRFLLGSVAEGIVRLALCDVLVVRPPDATSAHIEPACPRCVEARRASGGRELWCEQHREHHDRRHTYHFSPAASAHQSSFLIRL